MLFICRRIDRSADLLIGILENSNDGQNIKVEWTKFDEPKKPANVYSHMTKCIAAVSYFIAFVFFALFFLIYLADGDEDFLSIAAVIDVIYSLGVAISVPIIFKSGESNVDYDDEYVAASGYAFSSDDLPEL